jgi:broad specificity phosphatase PhoE
MSLEEHYAQGIFPVLSDPAAKYPEGESLHDLFARAERAVREIVMPHVWTAARAGARGVHIAVVSHGLCISRLVPALLQQGTAPPGRDYSGLKNTAWTRVEIELKVRRSAPARYQGTQTAATRRTIRRVRRSSSTTRILRRSHST